MPRDKHDGLYHYELAGIEGRGRTMKAAKEHVAERLRNAVAIADCPPRFFTYKGNAVCAWTSGANSGSYTLIWASEDRGEHFSSCSMAGTRDDAMRAGRQHLASVIGDVEAADKRDRETVQHDIIEAREFNRLYKAWKAAGANDNDAHRNACNRIEPGRPANDHQTDCS